MRRWAVRPRVDEAVGALDAHGSRVAATGGGVMAVCGLGHENVDGARFCTVCGSAMPATSTTPSVPDATTPVATTPVATPPEPVPSQANRRPLFIGIGAAAAVVVLALVAFLIVGAVSKAEVPDVAGLTAAEAATALEEAGLSAGSTSEVFDDAVPTGSVVSQVPSAGAEVDRGSPVSLVVSKGVELVTVTMRRDMSSTVLELDLADCDLAVVLWQAAYSDSELVDGDGEVLAGISGGWEAGEDNLEYFPC